MEKVLDDDVELTDDPDMITWDDDPENKRAKMPCGHAIGPESLTAYCRSLLTAGKCQFCCPYIDRDGIYCGQVWEYYTIRKLAVLTSDEKEEFERKLSQNYMRKASGIKECPKCTSFCILENKKDRRVICLLCSKDGSTYEFCCNCLGEWLNPNSTSHCGNSACSGEDPRLKILREAKQKTIVGLAGCPSIRACPKCGMVIYHMEACKHMVCICGQQFCFICLKKAVHGIFSCGNYDSHCTIAAIQVVMPDENEDIETENDDGSVEVIDGDSDVDSEEDQLDDNMEGGHVDNIEVINRRIAEDIHGSFEEDFDRQIDEDIYNSEYHREFRRQVAEYVDRQIAEDIDRQIAEDFDSDSKEDIHDAILSPETLHAYDFAEDFDSDSNKDNYDASLSPETIHENDFAEDFDSDSKEDNHDASLSPETIHENDFAEDFDSDSKEDIHDASLSLETIHKNDFKEKKKKRMCVIQ